MARILPEDWRHQAEPGARTRLIETLQRLEAGLPDDFTVFHGVHWSRPDTAIAQLADVDFVVLAPSGRLLLIEQKAGLLDESDRALSKRRHGQRVRISVHVGQVLTDLGRRLAPIAHHEPLAIDYLLYCPDYRVREPSTSGLPPGHVVDAQGRDRLVAHMLALFPREPARSGLAHRLHRFFANELELVPDAGALVGRANELFIRLADGLAIWARRFEVDPPRMRVSATAGSGKTQLALVLLEQARARGERALYVCFNRPLADHMSELLQGSAPSSVPAAADAPPAAPRRDPVADPGKPPAAVRNVRQAVAVDAGHHAQTGVEPRRGSAMAEADARQTSLPLDAPPVPNAEPGARHTAAPGAETAGERVTPPGGEGGDSAPAPAVRLMTYHQWCAQRMRAAGERVEFGSTDVYRLMAERSQALPVGQTDQVDCLIIDEGQDFEQAWADDLLRIAARDARIWWLEDPMQNLYMREPVQLPGWARLHTETNFRSPHAVVTMINSLLRPVPPVLAAGPVAGLAPEIMAYDDDEDLLARTKAAVALALRQGFRREDLVLVTLSGRARSSLLGRDRLGPHRLRRFTGRYDAAGHPLFTSGDLLIESVYRFKGQSAPCVILTEVAFEHWDELAIRKLFVGMTRASLHLIIVAHSDIAERLLAPAT
ncbi:MAG: ATP-binding domain-containing protein [Burkholderiaceae bacterium]